MVVTDHCSKIELLGRYFEEVHTKNSLLRDANFTQLVNNSIGNVFRSVEADFLRVFSDNFNSDISNENEISDGILVFKSIEEIFKTLKQNLRFGKNHMTFLA